MVAGCVRPPSLDTCGALRVGSLGNGKDAERSGSPRLDDGHDAIRRRQGLDYEIPRECIFGNGGICVSVHISEGGHHAAESFQDHHRVPHVYRACCGALPHRPGALAYADEPDAGSGIEQPADVAAAEGAGEVPAPGDDLPSEADSPDGATAGEQPAFEEDADASEPGDVGGGVQLDEGAADLSEQDVEDGYSNVGSDSTESLEPEAEADDPDGAGVALEAQSDSDDAYAILYSDGDLVFQRGDTEDPSKGEVLGKWTGFESATYAAGGAPWFSQRSNVKRAVVADLIAPVATKYWFYGCTSMRTAGLSGLDVLNVTSMSNMFYLCSSLQSLDLSDWQTSSLTDTSGMFTSCTSLESLDLSGWDTSNVTEMSAMFGGCTALRSIDVSFWVGALDLSECDSLASLTVNDGCSVSMPSGTHWLWEGSTEVVGDSFSSKAGTYVRTNRFQITKNAGEGGTIELRSYSMKPQAGTTVVFRTIPQAGKTLSTFSATYIDSSTGEEVRLNVPNGGLERTAGSGAAGTISEYSFEMPAAPVTINATFKANINTYKITKNMTGTGKAGSNLQLVGSDGKDPAHTEDQVVPTMYPKAGQTVYFKSVPAKGARLTKFNVAYSYTGLDGNRVDVKLYTGHGITSHGNGLYSFTMPCYSVTLTGEFTKG